MKILLASASPRRRELLATVGYDVVVFAPVVTEITEIDDNDFVRLAQINAQMKAREVYKTKGLMNQQVILSADTVVICDDEHFAKPADAHEARAMLKALSGIKHRVVTSYCLLDDTHELLRAVSTEVEFRALKDFEIDGYLKTNEWRDKAGAYAVQGLGAALIRHVVGSLTNVVGLPLEEVLRDADAFINRSR